MLNAPTTRPLWLQMPLYKTLTLKALKTSESSESKRACKNLHNSWMPEKAVVPQTHLIRYAPKTQDTLPVFFEMVAFKDPLILAIGYPSSLGSSFVIEIQTHARRKGLERIC